MSLLRSHGVTRNPELMTKESEGGWFYQQVELGFNYRMTDIQAALGLSQMKRLNEFVGKRHVLAKRYNELLVDLPIIIPWQMPDSYSGLHLYVIRLELDKIEHTHRDVFESLREQGIGVNLHYIPVHTQPFYQNLGFKQGDFPEAESYYTEAISLPMFPTMTETLQDQVIAALHKAVQV